MNTASLAWHISYFKLSQEGLDKIGSSPGNAYTMLTVYKDTTLQAQTSLKRNIINLLASRLSDSKQQGLKALLVSEEYCVSCSENAA